MALRARTSATLDPLRVEHVRSFQARPLAAGRVIETADAAAAQASANAAAASAASAVAQAALATTQAGLALGHAATASTHATNAGNSAAAAAASAAAAAATAAGIPPVFATQAAFAASSIITNNTEVVEEGGEGSWLYDAGTTSPITVTLGNGRKYRQVRNTLRPKHYGFVTGINVDNRQAWLDMIADMNWRGGGFEANFEDKDYGFCGTGTALPTNGSGLTVLENIDRARIRFNGARFACPVDFDANLVNFYLFVIRNCKGLVLEDFHTENTFAFTPYSGGIIRGMSGPLIVHGNQGIIFERPRLIRTAYGVTATFTVGQPQTQRNREVHVRDMHAEDTVYPASFQGNTDHSSITGRSINSVRTFHAYNVRGFEFDIDSTPGPMTIDDCTFGVYGDNGQFQSFNTMEHVRGRYRCRGDEMAADPTFSTGISMFVQSSTAAIPSMHIRDVQIDIDAEFKVAHANHRPMLSLIKQGHGAVVDGVQRHHRVEDVNVSMNVRNFANAGAGAALITALSHDWSGETVELRLHDTTVVQLPFSGGVAAGSLIGLDQKNAIKLRLERINAPAYPITTANIPVDGLELDDVRTSNYTAKSPVGLMDSFTPGLTFGGGNTGITYGARAGRYQRIGKWVHFFIQIFLSSKGTSTGIAQVTGLPFTAAAHYTPVMMYMATGAGLAGQHLQPLINTGGTSILLRYLNGANSADITDAHFGNATSIHLQGAYEMA